MRIIKGCHLGSGLEKRVAIFVEKSGDSQEDNAAASQDGFISRTIMETIFDHNATKDEIRKLLGNPAITKEQMLSFGLLQVQHWLKICTLYRIRNNNEKANEYLKKAKEQGFFQFKL